MGHERGRDLGGGLSAEPKVGDRDSRGEACEVRSSVEIDPPLQPAERKFAAIGQAGAVVGRRQVLQHDRKLGPPPAPADEGRQNVRERRRPAHTACERADVPARLQDQIAIEVLEAARDLDPAQGDTLALQVGQTEHGAAVPKPVGALDQLVRDGERPQ